jgi:cell division protein FtsB
MASQFDQKRANITAKYCNNSDLLPVMRVVYSPLMNAEFNLWDKLTRVVVFLLCIAGLLGVAVWYLPLINMNERYRKEILRYDARIQKEEEISNRLRTSISALRRDPKAIERLARESLGYGKPGETIIRFEAPSTNGPPHF